MRVIVFDTETTDLVGNDLLPLVKQPHIIELACILADLNNDGTYNELDRYEELFYPGFDISADTTRMTQITREMLMGKHTFANRYKAVEQFMGQAGVWAGHNVMFDFRMVRNEMLRAAGTTYQMPEVMLLCTAEISEFLMGKRSKLTDLYAHYYGAGHLSAHRAMADTEATLKCLAKLKQEGYV